MSRVDGTIRELSDAGVAGLTIGWADYNGIPRSRTVPIKSMHDVARTGVGVTPLSAVFDSSDAITYAHPGLATPSGDVRLIPDTTRITRLAGQPALAWSPGTIVTADGEPWPYDPRTALQRQVDTLAEAGLTARAGYELEFGVYLDEGMAPAHHGPAYGPAALTEIDGFVADVLHDFAANGLRIGQLHAEYGPAQVEVSLAAAEPVIAADEQLLARQTLRAAAHKHGLCLSFAPLPSQASAGNGWHLHTSLWRESHNLLAGGPEGPETDGAAYVAGILRDLPAVAAVSAPSLGSLARFRPGFFAGAYAFWGVENREAPLRYVPGSALLGADHANLELKTSDASGNPYLALAAVLAAGAAGVDEGLAPPPPVTEDPGSWSEAERAAHGIVALPTTQAGQEKALTASPRVTAALGHELLGAFLAVRRADAAAAEGTGLDDVLSALRWCY